MNEDAKRRGGEFLRLVYGIVKEHGDFARVGELVRKAPGDTLASALLLGSVFLHRSEVLEGRLVKDMHRLGELGKLFGQLGASHPGAKRAAAIVLEWSEELLKTLNEPPPS
jgi:hypothetical protein